MRVVNCDQLSDEWWELHRGRLTASRMGKVLTPKTAKLSAQADDVICELIGEQFYRGPMSDLTAPANKAMLDGIANEPEARRWYELHRGLDVEQVGFLTTDDGRFGASPDGLVGEDGGLEIKCPTPKVHAGYLIADALPDDYKAQVHGCLIVSGREWWDFLSYSPNTNLPPLLIRVTPDEYTAKLRAALEEFHAKLEGTLAKLGLQGVPA